MKSFKKQNIWFNKPELWKDETINLELAANLSRSNRAVGGKLFVTNRRIVFAPNRMDAVMGQKGSFTSLPIESIKDVSIEKGEFALKELFSGGLRSRLCIEMNDGGRYLFVVNRLEKTVSTLSEMLGC